MDPDDAVTVREMIFEKMQFPQANPKSQGLVCKTRIKGDASIRAILVEEGPLTTLMYDHELMTVTQSEFRRTRPPGSFFILLRFYAVYSVWDEIDGASSPAITALSGRSPREKRRCAMTLLGRSAIPRRPTTSTKDPSGGMSRLCAGNLRRSFGRFEFSRSPASLNTSRS